MAEIDTPITEFNWISPKDSLPPEGVYVLAHLNIDSWDCANSDPRFVVVECKRGITEEERAALPNTDARKLEYYPADVYGNNKLPFCWEEFGPGKHFGQDVDYWTYIPMPPGVSLESYRAQVEALNQHNNALVAKLLEDLK